VRALVLHVSVRTVSQNGDGITDMSRLTTGIRSEQCVVRRFRRRANVTECTYTNLDSTHLGYMVQHVTVLNTVGNCNIMVL
jgi:hypothetical protein